MEEEKNVRYFKGYNLKTDRHFFCMIFEEQQKDYLKDPYIIEYGYMDQSGRKFSNSVEEFKKEFYLAREIGKEEYDLYYNIQQLITEFYMNQITGGFPSKGVCGMGLDYAIRKAYKEVHPNDIAPTEAFANILMNSMKNRGAEE